MNAALKDLGRKAKSLVISRTVYFSGRALGNKAYFFINGAFRDEGRAVLAGNQIHFAHERGHRSQMFLRRSVHRIEKGLVTLNRRTTFAAEYIEPAVRTWIKLHASHFSDAGEMQWAADVFDKYFEATKESMNLSIKTAQELWTNTSKIGFESDTTLGPFKQLRLERDVTTSEVLSSLTNHRRSIRLFEDRPVPQELVDQAIAIGLTAPSACNRQSFRLAIIVDPIKRVQVARVPMGTAGFSDQIPAIAVVIGQHRGYEHHRDRHAVYVDGGLFATGFILALETLGLNSCCINWPEIPSREARLRELIDLDADERPIMMIAIGYGTDEQMVPRSHKREVIGIREWI